MKRGHATALLSACLAVAAGCGNFTLEPSTITVSELGRDSGWLRRNG